MITKDEREALEKGTLMITCPECKKRVERLIPQANDRQLCEACDLGVIHTRIKGMPISVPLVPAQIAALAAAAEFIIDCGGFPDNEELTEHLQNALRILDEGK
jgi:hypothetical protein